MQASVSPGFYSWRHYRSMPSTPPWAADRHLEAPYLRSELLWETPTVYKSRFPSWRLTCNPEVMPPNKLSTTRAGEGDYHPQSARARLPVTPSLIAEFRAANPAKQVESSSSPQSDERRNRHSHAPPCSQLHVHFAQLL